MHVGQPVTVEVAGQRVAGKIVEDIGDGGYRVRPDDPLLSDYDVLEFVPGDPDWGNLQAIDSDYDI